MSADPSRIPVYSALHRAAPHAGAYPLRRQGAPCPARPGALVSGQADDGRGGGGAGYGAPLLPWPGGRGEGWLQALFSCLKTSVNAFLAKRAPPMLLH